MPAVLRTIYDDPTAGPGAEEVAVPPHSLTYVRSVEEAVRVCVRLSHARHAEIEAERAAKNARPQRR